MVPLSRERGRGCEVKNYQYAVRFTGVEATPGKIKRHTHVMRGILAETSNAAIEKAQDFIKRNPKFKGLHYPTYSIQSVD